MTYVTIAGVRLFTGRKQSLSSMTLQITEQYIGLTGYVLG